MYRDTDLLEKMCDVTSVTDGRGWKVVWSRVEFWSELQKRANRANQLVLFFLAGANFWEKHAKNCAIMSLFWC